jgi:hypothetical protein
MKNNLIAVLLVLAFVLCLSNRAQACSCAKISACEAFGYSSAVFIGRMLGGKEKVREYTKDGETFSVESGESRFAVEESFKGVVASEVTVFLINMKGTSCEGMAALVRGQRYLVYASYVESVGMLAVGACSPTKPLTSANDDLAFLRHLPAEGSGGRLYGKVGVEVGRGEPTALPDVSIVIEDETHTQRQTKTDKNGEYEFSGLRPGKYVVNPVLTDSYLTNEYQRDRKVVVADRGCAQASFWVHVNGKVSGRVTDSGGSPAPAHLVLESTDGRERHFLGYTDDDGDYEIEGVAPGKYVLKIDLKKDGEDKSFYYPGTTDRSKATTLSLSMAQKLNGYDFHLPFQTFTIQGVVAYSDGKLASNVEVRLIPDQSANEKTYQVESLYVDTETDGRGRFSLRGYKGVTYHILVFDDLSRAIQENREPVRTETEKMVVDKDIDGLKVVLPIKPRAKLPTEDKKPPKLL